MKLYRLFQKIVFIKILSFEHQAIFFSNLICTKLLEVLNYIYHQHQIILSGASVNNNNMLDFESPRNKTTIFHRQNNPKRRLRSQSSNPNELHSPNYNEEANIQKVTSSKEMKVFYNSRGKQPYFSPVVHKNRQTSHLSVVQNEARQQLKKIPLKQKLFLIENLLKSTRDLCKIYGYFSITFPMLKLSFEEKIKIQIWIHPDRRCLKPLHPIKKPTQFQCELSCVFDLKNIIKILFPTIQLGSNKTFCTLLAYIDNLKLNSDSKKRIIGITRKDSAKTTEQQSCKLEKPQENYLSGTSKTIPTYKNITEYLQSIYEDSPKKKIKNNAGHKENSTLFETVGSVNSIRQKLYNIKSKQVSPVQKPRLKQSFSSPLPQQMYNNSANKPIQRVIDQVSPQKNQPKPQKQTFQTPQNKQTTSPNPNLMKISSTGRRLMTMSIEIESQINNLFSNDDLCANNYYSSSQKNTDIKNLKNSLLSRVAEQFQDLF